jgi:hypothetical protein
VGPTRIIVAVPVHRDHLCYPMLLYLKQIRWYQKKVNLTALGQQSPKDKPER